MSSSSSTSFDPNSIRWIIALNAFHNVLSTIDANLPIETQFELVENMPDGRFYDVCPIESMSGFHFHFLSEQYKSAIQGKLFAGFPTYEDKMLHALSAQAIASIPDATTLDYDKQYNLIKGDFRRKFIEYLFDNGLANLTITPNETAIGAILLRKTLKQYCAEGNNAFKTVGIILGAVERFLPNIIELRKCGLSLPLYLSLLEEISSLYITHSLNCVLYKPNTPGLSDATSKAKLKEALEKIKASPDVPENFLSGIQIIVDTSEKAVKKNSNSGCLGILILLLTLIPALGYAASKLIF